MVRAADAIAREYSVQGGPLYILRNWPTQDILLTARILSEGNEQIEDDIETNREEKKSLNAEIRAKRKAAERRRKDMLKQRGLPV